MEGAAHFSIGDHLKGILVSFAKSFRFYHNIALLLWN
jgi:hypothetical protein